MSSHIVRSLNWNCPVHGEFSNLNRCAWPDCPHGVAESNVTAAIPGLDRAEAFRRLTWRGQNGDEYHDWQTADKPTWFSLPRAYGYFERKMVNYDYLDQMFHYTSADGAVAIVQSGRLRLTDYAYLNDTREVTFGLDLMRSVLNDIVLLGDSRALTDLKQHLCADDPFGPYNIYTASFSSEPDSLSQFRLYGKVALGFETNAIGFGYFRGDSTVGRIVYEPARQAALIRNFFELIKQSEEKDATLSQQDEKNKIQIRYILGDLLRICALFKHPAFSDEKEVRLLYSEPLEIMDKFGEVTAPRQFRVSGGLIVPFTDTIGMTREFRANKGKQDDGKLLPLKSVVIGPMAQADALARGMRDLLSFHGYHDVEVSLSEAPLRS